MKTYDLKVGENPTRTIEILKEMPGVKNAWQYRGRLFVAIRENDLVKARKCFKINKWKKVEEFDAGTLVFASKWIHPGAFTKQEEVRNARETKELVEAHYEHLQHLLSIHSYSDEEYEELDGSESPYDLQVPEGYQGHYYKEDFDLERAGKQEDQL